MDDHNLPARPPHLRTGDEPIDRSGPWLRRNAGSRQIPGQDDKDKRESKQSFHVHPNTSWITQMMAHLRYADDTADCRCKASAKT